MVHDVQVVTRQATRPGGRFAGGARLQRGGTMAVSVINAGKQPVADLELPFRVEGLQELRLPMFKYLRVPLCMTQDLGGQGEGCHAGLSGEVLRLLFVEVKVLRSRVLRPTKQDEIRKPMCPQFAITVAESLGPLWRAVGFCGSTCSIVIFFSSDHTDFDISEAFVESEEDVPTTIRVEVDVAVQDLSGIANLG